MRVTALAALALAGCAASREVRVLSPRPPVEGARGACAVAVGSIAIEAPKGVSASEEARRFLEGELEARTGLAAEPAAGAACGPRLEVRATGRFEERTVGSAGTTSIERDTVLPGLPPPNRRPRWAHGYALELAVEIVDRDTGRRVFERRFSPELPARERPTQLFALYELLEPVAAAIGDAIAGERKSERRTLVLP